MHCPFSMTGINTTQPVAQATPILIPPTTSRPVATAPVFQCSGVPNGNLSPGCVPHAGYLCGYTCNHGYTKMASVTDITCMHDSQWGVDLNTLCVGMCFKDRRLIFLRTRLLQVCTQCAHLGIILAAALFNCIHNCLAITMYKSV
jgi:hypothetical protein